jgi:hypothetical protein
MLFSALSVLQPAPEIQPAPRLLYNTPFRKERLDEKLRQIILEIKRRYFLGRLRRPVRFFAGKWIRRTEEWTLD